MERGGMIMKKCIIMGTMAFAVLWALTRATAVELQPVVSGLSRPLYVTGAKDGTARLFIVEQRGVIKVLQPGSNTPTTFLSITNKVLNDFGERGLLWLAFHPNYAIDRRFYVNYTRQGDGATVIAQYRVSGTNANSAGTTEKILLVVPQPFANHNGGMLEFGNDGFLYIGLGDGGSGNDPDNRAQNVNELLGKILRIDVNHSNGSVPYSSPSDNPFFGSTAGRDEIWAFGLRNPWRFSFDRSNGKLYVGDVGQDEIEEVDIITRGGNYGWRVFEGTRCTGNDPGLCDPNNYLFPIAQYDHGNPEVRCAITGGYVYRGARGAVSSGAYIFGDYCSGEIYSLNPPAAGGLTNRLLDTSLNISSFGEDEAGELYVVNLGGTVTRLVSSPPPSPCSYSISPFTQTIPAGGGNGSFSLTTTGDCGWIAASYAKWITITSATRGFGSTTLRYAVAPNSTGANRKGRISIAGKNFTVKQLP